MQGVGLKSRLLVAFVVDWQSAGVLHALIGRKFVMKWAPCRVGGPAPEGERP